LVANAPLSLRRHSFRVFRVFASPSAPTLRRGDALWLALTGRVPFETWYIFAWRIPNQSIRRPNLHGRVKSTGIIQAAHGHPDEISSAVGTLSARKARAAIGAKPPLMKPAGIAGGAVVLGFSLGEPESVPRQQDRADMGSAAHLLAIAAMAFQRGDGRCVGLVANRPAHAAASKGNLHAPTFITDGRTSTPPPTHATAMQCR
jgi:hypothetical protein